MCKQAWVCSKHAHTLRCNFIGDAEELPNNTLVLIGVNSL